MDTYQLVVASGVVAAIFVMLAVLAKYFPVTGIPFKYWVEWTLLFIFAPPVFLVVLAVALAGRFAKWVRTRKGETR